MVHSCDRILIFFCPFLFLPGSPRTTLCKEARCFASYRPIAVEARHFVSCPHNMYVSALIVGKEARYFASYHLIAMEARCFASYLPILFASYPRPYSNGSKIFRFLPSCSNGSEMLRFHAHSIGTYIFASNTLYFRRNYSAYYAKSFFSASSARYDEMLEPIKTL